MPNTKHPAPPQGDIRCYDIIGDSHGAAGAVEAIFDQWGYKRIDGIPMPPKGTQVIWNGDLISRGDQIQRTVEIAAAQEQAGKAVILQGNHDFNYTKAYIIATQFSYFSRRELRAFHMTPLQVKHCQESYAAFKIKSKTEAKKLAEWILPHAYSFQNGKLLITHAFGDENNVALIDAVRALHPAAPLYVSMLEDKYETGVAAAIDTGQAKILQEMNELCGDLVNLSVIAALENKHERSISKAVTETLKGRVYHLDALEKLAPELTGVDKRYDDAHGVKRCEARILPWVTNVKMVHKIDDILLLPPHHLGDALHNNKQVARKVANEFIANRTDTSLHVNGHYSVSTAPKLTDPRHACVDFKNHVTGYRYLAGDQVFYPERLLAVPK